MREYINKKYHDEIEQAYKEYCEMMKKIEQELEHQQKQIEQSKDNFHALQKTHQTKASEQHTK